ncbi:MAG: hypothetical protein PVH68_13960 [Armatimonadota bacterium]|jgi:hypothetical protein
MRHVTSMLIVVVVLAAGAQAPADTMAVRPEYHNAEDIAGCLAEVMARVAPQLDIAEEDLVGLLAVPVPERNEVLIAGTTTAVELARKVLRALDVPRPQVWLSAEVIRTDDPADILRLPEGATTVRIDGESVTVPDEALGIQRPVPRELPTLVCVPAPNVAAVGLPDAGHRVVSSPRIVTLSGHQAKITVGSVVPAGPAGDAPEEEAEVFGHEVTFVPSVLPDGSISVVLTLYHRTMDQEEPDEIELVYVAQDGVPWAFALLPPEHEEGPTTVFVVTVSAAELN